MPLGDGGTLPTLGIVRRPDPIPTIEEVRTCWPEGVIADDVIRYEVRRLRTARPVVVVTNDAEIVADVKALVANVVPSNALIAHL